MTLIISKGGKNAVKVNSKSIEREQFLQEYIHQNPESIPLDEIKQGARPVVVVREFGTGSGPIDALMIDEDGDLYLIETKLYKNPDKRLVVAQVLDYGASLSQTYRDATSFERALDNALLQSKAIGLRQRLKEDHKLPEEGVARFFERLEDNLREGRFKFVVLMDTLEQRLKDLIVFLNRNSNFAVFAVEVEYYEHEGYEIVRPKLFGVEARQAVGGREIQRWDEESFFADASAKLAASEAAAVRKLYEFSKRMASQIDWGGGVTGGSFNPKFPTISVRSVYTVTSNGVLYLNFKRLDDGENALRVRDALKQKLERLKGFAIPENFRDRMIVVHANAWCPVVDEFIGIISGLLGSARPRGAISS